MNLSTAQILKNALKLDAVDKSDLDLALIRQHIHDLDEVSAEISKRISRPNAGFAFLRLKPVSFEPQKLYGQNVKSDNALELAACSAMLNDAGKWVPNENDILFTTLITERGISDLIFNVQSCKVEPTQITSLDGVPVATPTATYSHAEQYGGHFYETIDLARQAIATAKREAERLQDTGVKLNKTEKEELAEAQWQLDRYARSDLDFCIEIDSEQAEKDVHHLKMEVLSSITSHITKVAEPLRLVDKSSMQTIESTPEKVFRTRIRDVLKLGDVATLIRRYAPHYEPSDKANAYRRGEDQKDILHLANRYENKHILETYRNCELGKGSLSMTRPSTRGMTLFGDARSVQHYYTLSLQFSAERVRSFGEVETQKALDLMQFSMTDFQIMELVRGSLAGDWVNATLAYYGQRSVHFSKDTETDQAHDVVKVDVPDLPDSSRQLAALVDELGSLLASKSQAKATREAILAAVEKIETLLDREVSERDELYKETRDTMLRKYQDSALPQMERVLERVGQLHPELKATLHKRLTDKIGD